MRLEGKTAIVTGAGGGFGEEIARRFAASSRTGSNGASTARTPSARRATLVPRSSSPPYTPARAALHAVSTTVRGVLRRRSRSWT